MSLPSSDRYPEITLPGPEPEPETGIVPWSEIGATAWVTGAAFDADGTPLDAEGNRLESANSTNSDNQE